MASAVVVSFKSHVLNVSILHYDYSLNPLKFQSHGKTNMDIASFKQKLANLARDFEYSRPLKEACAHFRFVGDFMGKPTIWDAHLYTLAYYVYEVAEISQPGSSIRPFIHVGDVDKMGRKIEIGLNLLSIDEPAIIKTMIMVRQYKRLAIGRHNFGETISV